MSTPTTAPDPCEEFYLEIHAAFLAAGPPTYARLVAIMREQAEKEGHIARRSSALQTIMSGGRKTLPNWATLSAIIRALRTAATETGLDPNCIGTLQHWYQRLHDASGQVAATSQ